MPTIVDFHKNIATVNVSGGVVKTHPIITRPSIIL